MFWLMLAIFAVLAIGIASTVIFWTAQLIMLPSRLLFPPKPHDWQADVRPRDRKGSYFDLEE
jgi:hypothetical protein